MAIRCDPDDKRLIARAKRQASFQAEALAGVPAGAAVVATLSYRLVSFWLPIPAGGVAALLHRRHYGEIPETTPA